MCSVPQYLHKGLMVLFKFPILILSVCVDAYVCFPLGLSLNTAVHQGCVCSVFIYLFNRTME